MMPWRLKQIEEGMMEERLSHDEFAGKTSVSLKKDGGKGNHAVCLEVNKAAGANGSRGTLRKRGLS
jgi:hypothetical protein